MPAVQVIQKRATISSTDYDDVTHRAYVIAQPLPRLWVCAQITEDG